MRGGTHTKPEDPKKLCVLPFGCRVGTHREARLDRGSRVTRSSDSHDAGGRIHLFYPEPCSEHS